MRMPINRDSNAIAEKACQRKHGRFNAGMRRALRDGMATDINNRFSLTHSHANGRLYFRSREDAMRAAELLSSAQKPDFSVKVWHRGECVFDSGDSE